MKRFFEKIRSTVAAEVRAIAAEALETARELAPEGTPPRDEPRLKDSFSIETEGLTARVVVHNPHAAYVEFGTGQRGAGSPSPPKAPGARGYDPDWAGMAARPYLYPAAQAARADYARRLAEAVRRELT